MLAQGAVAQGCMQLRMAESIRKGTKCDPQTRAPMHSRTSGASPMGRAHRKRRRHRGTSSKSVPRASRHKQAWQDDANSTGVWHSQRASASRAPNKLSNRASCRRPSLLVLACVGKIICAPTVCLFAVAAPRSLSCIPLFVIWFIKNLSEIYRIFVTFSWRIPLMS